MVRKPAWTIRRKMTIFVVAMGVAAIMITVIFQAILGSVFLIGGLRAEYASVAAMIGREVAASLGRDTDYIGHLVETTAVRPALAKVDDRYNGLDGAAVDELLLEEDARWADPERGPAAVREVLGTPLSRRLATLVRDMPFFGEIMITDRYGGLVAASGRTSDYYQADETWWKRAAAAGAGEQMIEEVSYDLSSATLGLVITMPIHDAAGELAGVCKAVVDAKRYWHDLAAYRIGKTGCVALIDRNGLALFHHDAAPLSVRLLGAGETALLIRRGWIVANGVPGYADTLLMSCSKVRSPLLAERGMAWYVVVSQSLDEAFAPLRDFFLISIALLVVLVMVSAVFVSFVTGRMFRPLARLREGVRRFAEGDYMYRIDLKTGDELQDLSELCNTMADRIERARAALQKHALQVERQRNHLDAVNAELSAANRQLRAAQEELAAQVAERTAVANETQAAVINMMEDLQASKEELELSSARTLHAYEELKELQRRLVQSEKMSALGRFSAGIAHEVKNPLAIILGGMEYLQAKLAKADEDTKTVLGKIKEAVLRADSVLQNLLKFSRPAKLETEVIAPEALVEEVLSLFKYKFPLLNIHLKTVVAGKGMRVKVDKNQIEQVLFNLMMNASDAMPKGGPITVTVSRIVEREEGERPRAFCVIAVEDAGEGIAPEDLAKLFEPFFTTKRDRGGTGLGLAVARSIIEHHEGTLTLESEAGKGTVARITLPLASHA